MIMIFGVQPHNAGFGMYQRDAEGETFGDLENVYQYIHYMRQQNPGVEFIDDDDDDYKLVEHVDGLIYDQNGGTVIAWRYPNGEVQIELMFEGGNAPFDEDE